MVAATNGEPESLKKKRKGLKRGIVITIILALVIFRILLPTIVKNYVNKVLADLPGYYGQVTGIDISLLRGAYVIEGMYLNVVDAGTEVPFLDFPETDISVEWSSIFDGRIVAEIIMGDPQVTYVMEDQEGDQEANVDDWTKALTDLVPLDINHFEVHRGKLGIVELQAEPNIDLTMTGLELTADNLSNVVAKKGTLPSTVKATAVTFGDGDFVLDGRMNLLKEIPDMDISFSLEKSDATALNDLTKHYAKLDFNKGTFEIFGEVAIADGYMKGYVKPFITDSDLIGPDDGFLSILWEGFVGFFKFILKNQRTDSVALKVPFEGDLENVETGVWPAVGSIVKNAWFEAFKGESDDEIEFKDASTAGEDETKEERKERKKEERQERKEEKEKEKSEKD